jgi:hypothetical protein
MGAAWTGYPTRLGFTPRLGGSRSGLRCDLANATSACEVRGLRSRSCFGSTEVT